MCEGEKRKRKKEERERGRVRRKNEEIVKERGNEGSDKRRRNGEKDKE